MKLVYLSPVAWDSFAQRPHKFAQWFHARSGGEVLWIDPYPTRLPTLADFTRRVAAAPVRQTTPDWLTVVRPRGLPIEPLPLSGTVHRVAAWRAVQTRIARFSAGRACLLGIGKPSKLALQTLAAHPLLPSFYDAMDDFPAFYSGLSRRSMLRREDDLVARVGTILVSSTALKQRFHPHRQRMAFVPNACALESLPPVAALPSRPERVVLGYVGTIAQWFDWPLVIALARQNPSATVRLIGPVHTQVPELPSNVDMLPACSHADAIRAMSSFSIGLIPFKRTPLTVSVDPIKYYEYRALGLPVISTPFGEMCHHQSDGGVLLADEHADLARCVATALERHDDPDAIEAFRAANGWDARFDQSGLLDRGNKLSAHA